MGLGGMRWGEVGVGWQEVGMRGRTGACRWGNTGGVCEHGILHAAQHYKLLGMWQALMIHVSSSLPGVPAAHLWSTALMAM